MHYIHNHTNKAKPNIKEKHGHQQNQVDYSVVVLFLKDIVGRQMLNSEGYRFLTHWARKPLDNKPNLAKSNQMK